MLSRVAAVMAPRTHNRCHVTGFSGRRREGGESERQRPNMSRRVFTSTVLLLVVVMMCDTGRAVQAAEPTSDQGSSPSPSFVWRDMKKDGETVDSLYVPSLVEVNGGVFAFAVALLKKDENEKTHFFTGIASELLALSEENPKELAAANVKTKILENCSSQGGKCPSQSTKQDASQSEMKVYVSRPTTVVKESDIYMLAGTYIRENVAVCQGGPGAASWGLLLVKGNVSDTEGKEIVWEDTDGLPCSSIVGLHESLTGEIGSGGSGVKMNDGTLVFPLEAVKKEKDDAEKDGKNKNVSLIIYSLDTTSWTLSKGMSADGCSDPSVVEWKGKLMMMTACDDGRRRVYESGDKGDSWTEALGTLSCVWGNNQKRHEKGVRSGFITATIEDRDVMLVTLPVYSKEEDNSKGVLHLWLTDNTHIVDIGPVSGDDDDAAASSLLYKSGNNKELIALYEKKGDGESSHGMVSVLLTEQLKRVKEVLVTWKEVDERVSSLCPTSIAEKDVSSDTACTTDKITDGLVGFLSGEFSGDTWKDEYLGVNATVKKGAEDGAEKKDNGVTFKGRGAWAEWPVGSQGDNQLYHFANYNFTLVATVSIHGETKRDTPIPLMGVRADSDGVTKLMELSYDSGKKWQALCCDGKTTEHSNTWEKDKTYQVAIVLQNGKQGSVYVDGQRVCESVQSNLENTESKGISHFYIGGDGGNAENTAGDEGVSVTVRNVLLYNRPMTFTGGSADLEEDIASPSKASVEQVPTASSSHAVGEAAGNAGTVRGSGLLPSLLLLLLGLWVYAAL
ncbi:putative trans-sialidase, Group V [Trypanosoma cruzi]|nr:putative trans-sialidase, Group V [Trypanosoma cruzi]